ncbi:MAG TPA: transporter substrate-binding domain-containing protein [Alphaproteobacteria bacterium]|nr:amino acid ABC transporter substrate-binding protein [Alphaproteobacteria bacterium]HOO50708.1 transporter substrate-binding domain-containing protein [Alphaproteobacteria bacterium]
MIKNVLVLILLCVMGAIVVAPTAAHADQNKIFDQIMKSGTIRCGYYVWPPVLSKDPASGELSGISHEIMEQMAAQLSLKIDWVAELNFDSMFEGFQTGRYDMICAPLALTPARARVSDYTVPFIFGSYYLYSRAGDDRFKTDYKAANSKDYTYASLDGDLNEQLGKDIFPLTQKISIGNVASNTDVLMMVVTGKADVTTMEPVATLGFMRKNPDKLRRVGDAPVQVLPLAYPVPQGEEKLKAMLNITIGNMIDVGVIDRILATYPDYDETLLRVSPRYSSGR